MDIQEVPEVTEWQLKRLMTELYFTNAYREFHGLYVQAFIFHPESISQVDWRWKWVEVKTMGMADINWFKDTLFREPHYVLQVKRTTSILYVGFWSDELDKLKEWIKEQMPDVSTINPEQRIFSRQIPME